MRCATEAWRKYTGSPLFNADERELVLGEYRSSVSSDEIRPHNIDNWNISNYGPLDTIWIITLPNLQTTNFYSWLPIQEGEIYVDSSSEEDALPSVGKQNCWPRAEELKICVREGMMGRIVAFSIKTPIISRDQSATPLTRWCQLNMGHKWISVLQRVSRNKCSFFLLISSRPLSVSNQIPAANVCILKPEFAFSLGTTIKPSYSWPACWKCLEFKTR